ncbi:PASTA domain-containing protein [Asanoa sp. NPDC050611]|uniref:PASTA domain-containing protein n=1 Tax=Asanoa sp. NPDC050611 TaxID=3157098 RepID=UPI0033D52A02
MADQPEDPPARRGAGSDDQDQPLDRTAPFDPIRDDDEPATDGRTDDAAAETQRLPDDPDRTARIEPTADDRTTQMSPVDRGVPPEDDRTTRIQQSTPRNATPPEDPAWAGRAGVPERGGPGEPPDDGPPDGYEPAAPGGGSRWWMPILIGIIALVLLGVLAFGLWLILRGDDTPASEPTRTTPAATTPAPTTAAPTTPAPTPTATTPAAVTVPILEGLTVEEATQRLSALGLSARLNYVDSNRPAGTVVGSNPAPNAQVPSGTAVTMDVSSGPRPTTEPPSPTVNPTLTSSPSIPPGP